MKTSIKHLGMVLVIAIGFSAESMAATQATANETVTVSGRNVSYAADYTFTPGPGEMIVSTYMEVEIVNTINNQVYGGHGDPGPMGGSKLFKGTANGMPIGTYTVNYYGSCTWMKNMIITSQNKVLLKTITITVP